MSEPKLMMQLLQQIFPRKRITDLRVIIEERSLDGFHDSRGIRLDVYSENDEAMSDVEIQVLERDLLPKRARYYQALIDAAALRKGEDYRKLKDQYVIFVCPFDRPVITCWCIHSATGVRKTEKNCLTAEK